MKFIRELLNEKSPLSMMRFMSILSLFIAGIIACYGVYVGRDPIGLAALCGVFVGGSFGGKAAQKFVEVKNSNVNIGDSGA